MKSPTLLFGLVGLWFVTAATAQPTVSLVGPGYDNLEHSSVRLIVDISGTFTHLRTRIHTSSCASGSGGTVQNDFFERPGRFGVTISLPALPPNTALYLCPEASNGGSVWSTGTEVQVTTPSAPAVHPALPVPPEEVPVAYPDTTGYVQVAVNNCANLQTEINAANARQATTGTLILLDPSLACTGSYTFPRAVDAVTVTYANTTQRWTRNSHGLVDGDRVILSSTAGYLPGTSSSAYPGNTHSWVGPYQPGYRYYVVNATANDFQLSATAGGGPVSIAWGRVVADAAADTLTTRQHPTLGKEGSTIAVNAPLYFSSTGDLPGGLSAHTPYYAKTGCPFWAAYDCAFQVSTSPGGAAVNMTSAGTGIVTLYTSPTGNGTNYMLKDPPADAKWIIVRTATPDSEFVPEGVRVTPEFHSKMPQLQASPASTPLTFDRLSRNIRIVGVRITNQPDTQMQTSINPVQYGVWLEYMPESTRIILDRVSFGPDSRMIRMRMSSKFGSGSYAAVINSSLTNLYNWVPTRLGLPNVDGLTFTENGMLPSLVSGSLHIAPGKIQMTDVLAPTLTGTTIITPTGGSASGSGLVYFDMNGTLQVRVPSGITASCSASVACTVQSGAASLPVDGSGREQGQPMADMTFTSGAITAVSQPYLVKRGYAGSDSAEGTQFGYGLGPGPILFQNNLVEATGTTLHFDDSGNSWSRRADFLVRRNTFRADPFFIPRHFNWGGLRSAHRQMLEWKGGYRIGVIGNHITDWPDITRAGSSVAFAAYDTRHPMNDIEVSHNLVRGGVGIGLAGVAASGATSYHSILYRFKIHNNLIDRINAMTWTAPWQYPGWGSVLVAGGGPSDVTISNNTFFDNRGVGSTGLWWRSPVGPTDASHPAEGWRVIDNVWMNPNAFLGQCSWGTVVNSALLTTCMIPNGTVELGGNAVVPYWANPQAGTGVSSASTACTSWGGTCSGDGSCLAANNSTCSGAPFIGYLPRESTVAARFAGLGFYDTDSGDYRLRATSPLQSGAKLSRSGRGIGVDYEELLRQLGVIRMKDVLSITRTSATVAFQAPDRGGQCRIAYGAGDDPVTWTGRSAVDTGEYSRAITLTGLLPGTVYRYRVWCAGTAQSETRVFRTVD
jgi:hypothetical protein